MINLELLKFLFSYDPEGYFIWIGKIGKSGTLGKKIKGACNKQSGYFSINIKGKTYYLHRLIFFFHTGLMPKFVDHINGDRSDNRIENLREATSQENAFNRRALSASGIKGIWFDKNEETWRAQIKVGPKRVQIRRKNKEELIKILNEKRKELHGNFARN